MFLSPNIKTFRALKFTATFKLMLFFLHLFNVSFQFDAHKIPHAFRHDIVVAGKGRVYTAVGKGNNTSEGRLPFVKSDGCEDPFKIWSRQEHEFKCTDKLYTKVTTCVVTCAGGLFFFLNERFYST